MQVQVIFNLVRQSIMKLPGPIFAVAGISRTLELWPVQVSVEHILAYFYDKLGVVHATGLNYEFKNLLKTHSVIF
jgi:hypothetical protein